MMHAQLKESLWKQFGAGIDMLKGIIRICPESYLHANKKIYYQVYHCLIFLDYYLTIPPKNFSPALPYTLVSPENIPVDAVDDILPVRLYSRDELLSYVDFCRKKCSQLLADLTEEQMQQRWIDEPDELAASSVMNFSVYEILLYNMRHVQHHVGQLNLLLRQGINNAADYVSQAEVTT